MANKLDTAAQKASGILSRTPLVSIFTAAAAPVALLGLAIPIDNPSTVWPLFAVGLTSPFVNGLAAANGALNLFRSHSNLSKTFSAAATVAGVAGIGGVLAYIDKPDFQPLSGYVLSMMAMTAAGLLNTAAYYTRGVAVKLSASISKNDNNPPPPAPPAP